MSVRLRLTLLYTAILGATLLLLGVALYVTVAQATRGAVGDRLSHTAARLAAAPVRDRQRGWQDVLGDGRGIEDRDMLVQLSDIAGAPLVRSPTLGVSTLSLSDAGLRRVRAGHEWQEIQTIGGEPVLLVAAPSWADGRLTSIVVVGHSIQQQQQALDTLRSLMLVGGSLATVLALGAGWLLAGAALRPIDQITQSARAIGVARDFRRRVQHAGPRDELGRLAMTINAMLAALDEAHHQTEQALLAQRRFVADASHELRTPLTTLGGNLALLQRDPPIEPADQAAVLADSIAECQRLSRLVNDLLTLARADAGVALSRAPVELRAVAEAVCRRIQPLAAAHELRGPDGPAVIVEGNRDAITQVLTILLDNALKFTPAGGWVSIATASEGGQGLLSVSDSGPGIPAELQPQIFERFFRIDQARTGEGAGLGLAIAQTLTLAQDGALSVESMSGQGSRFTLRLPLAPLIDQAVVG